MCDPARYDKVGQGMVWLGSLGCVRLGLASCEAVCNGLIWSGSVRQLWSGARGEARSDAVWQSWCRLVTRGVATRGMVRQGSQGTVI